MGVKNTEGSLTAHKHRTHVLIPSTAAGHNQFSHSRSRASTNSAQRAAFAAKHGRRSCALPMRTHAPAAVSPAAPHKLAPPRSTGLPRRPSPGGDRDCCRAVGPHDSAGGRRTAGGGLGGVRGRRGDGILPAAAGAYHPHGARAFCPRARASWPIVLLALHTYPTVNHC
jgi:hypothetical protein